MNLYLINLSVPDRISSLSTESITILRNLPRHRDDHGALVLLGLNTSQTLSKISTIRKRLPHAWIVVILPRTQLMTQKMIYRLANISAKNDVCAREDWRSRFWFMLQTAVDHHKRSIKHSKLVRERRDVHHQMESIATKTATLIAQLESNLEIAENVQRSILPQFTPEIPGIPVSVKYLPAAGVGGDYYDIFEFGDRRRFGFLLADSQSHGMAAALLGVLLKIRLEEMKDRFPDTKGFVDFVARELFTHKGGELTRLSLLYAILDRHTLTLEFTVAGALKPKLIRHSKLEPILIHHNPALGGVDEHKHQDNRLLLKPGDTLLFHTNGLDAVLEPRAVHSILSDLPKRNAQPDSLSLQNEILAQIRARASSGPLTDDITLITLNIEEKTLYVANHS